MSIFVLRSSFLKNGLLAVALFSFLLINTVRAEEAAPVISSTQPEVVVIGKLDEQRDRILPSLGSSRFDFSQDQIDSQSQGANASFNQIVLRAPGVAEDSFGQLHVRGEHANLQYRINDVLLPEGISGFGQELDARFIKNMSLMTGSLPAQYGFRTAGVIDIHTKSGAQLDGGSVSMYGGSFGTYRPSFEYGEHDGNASYYFSGSDYETDLGIENPTNRYNPIHDESRQTKGFTYLSWVLDDTSRLSFMASGSNGDFKIPNNPGQAPGFVLAGTPTFDSTSLNETQREQNDYAVVAYQKSVDEIDFQAAAFTRYSDVLFRPDRSGDLIFNGVASRVNRDILANGFQGDISDSLTDDHTLRGGILFTGQTAGTQTVTDVFPGGPGVQSSTTPFSISDSNEKTGYLAGLYLQDEWHVVDPLTINYGARFDVMDQYIQANQVSPRVNAVYKVTSSTTLHAGYARYFTPPPLELVSSGNINKFTGTSNEPEIKQSSAVRPERAHYLDVGVTHQFSPEFQMGFDGYYKRARHQLDEGQFGQALIFSPFNYQKGEVYGTEVTADYSKGGFTSYANFAWSYATGRNIESGQFQFSQDELDYARTHNVFLDHDQRFTASFGESYSFCDTKVYADLLFGSGLRKGFANTEQLSGYFPLNLGVSHTFKTPGVGEWVVRFDVVNVFDQIYELRDGSGIGVGAPQFGARRGFYGGLTFNF